MLGGEEALDHLRLVARPPARAAPGGRASSLHRHDLEIDVDLVGHFHRAPTGADRLHPELVVAQDRLTSGRERASVERDLDGNGDLLGHSVQAQRSHEAQLVDAARERPAGDLLRQETDLGEADGVENLGRRMTSSTLGTSPEGSLSGSTRR